METIQRDSSKKKNSFSEVLSEFFESALNFEDFQEKVTLIAYVFPNLLTPKDALRKISKRCPLEACSRHHMGNG